MSQIDSELRLLRQRLAHLEEQQIADLFETTTDESDIRNAIENLAQQMSLPDFIHIPIS